MKLYVGGLAWATTDDSLQAAFAQFGAVTSARVVIDRETGKSRGFGFVEMASKEEGEAAIAGLNGQELDGRAITVNEARPEDPNRSRGGSNGGNRDRGGRSNWR